MELHCVCCTTVLVGLWQNTHSFPHSLLCLSPTQAGSGCIYIVYTGWNSVDLTLSHYTRCNCSCQLSVRVHGYNMRDVLCVYVLLSLGLFWASRIDSATVVDRVNTEDVQLQALKTLALH